MFTIDIKTDIKEFSERLKVTRASRGFSLTVFDGIMHTVFF